MLRSWRQFKEVSKTSPQAQCHKECLRKCRNIGKDQKGLHKRGIHDQGDFYKNLLEMIMQNALKMRKSDLFMDTPFVDTPFGPAREQNGVLRKATEKVPGARASVEVVSRCRLNGMGRNWLPGL